MVVTPQSVVVTSTINIPLSIDLTEPVRYVFGIGDYTSYFPFSIIQRTIPTCTSLSSGISSTSSPSPITYNGDQNLTLWLIEWLSTHNTLGVFDGSGEGQALQQYFASLSIGNDYLFQSVELSDDLLMLVFTYQSDLTRWLDSCNLVTATVSSTQWNYVVPVQSAMQNAEGTWLLSETTYSITFDTAGSVIVEQAVGLYPMSAQLINVNATTDGCGSGSAALLTTFNVTFHNVGTNHTVGPLLMSDIFNSTTIDCYNDQPVSFTIVGCELGACVYEVVLRSECRVLDLNGDSFETCNPGASQNTSILDGVHGFLLQPFSCTNVSEVVNCTTLGQSLQQVSAKVVVPVYPTVFVETPDLLVDFALLESPSNLHQHIVQRVHRRV